MVLLNAFIGICAAPWVRAQELKRFDNILSEGTALHIFAKEGEVTVQVLLLGEVGSPGVYEIGTQIRLDQLLALAGGTAFDRDTRITIRVFRGGTSRRNKIYEAKVQDFIEESDRHPILQEGDVVTVESKQRNRLQWRDYLRIANSVTAIVTLVKLFQ